MAIVFFLRGPQFTQSSLSPSGRTTRPSFPSGTPVSCRVLCFLRNSMIEPTGSSPKSAWKTCFLGLALS
eukprot:XP_001710226.1 Hypothetical protein GL50803_38342 [Giardia lamblia ATCC 50803]